jgi:hypothetical protein
MDVRAPAQSAPRDLFVRVNPVVPRPISSFENDVFHVSRALQAALAALVNAVPGTPKRATDFQRRLNLGTEQSWQVFRTMSASDPREAVMFVPKRASIEKVLKAARASQVPVHLVDSVADHFSAFERLIAKHAEDREHFDVMASGLTPAARAKADLAARKSVFSGMTQVRGVSSRVQAVAHIIYPSSDPTRCDQAILRAEYELRRLRPGAFVGETVTAAYNTGVVIETLDRTPVGGPDSGMLPEFCSRPTPRFDAQQRGNVVEYALVGHEVGLTSAVDIVGADLRRGVVPVVSTHPEHSIYCFAGTETPTRRLQMDVFLHESVLEGIEPRLVAHQVGFLGTVMPFDPPERHNDRLELFQGLVSLGQDPRALETAGVPRYAETVGYVCDRLGWRCDQLRGYRFEIEYPLWGAQYTVGFLLPR